MLCKVQILTDFCDWLNICQPDTFIFEIKPFIYIWYKNF